MAVAWDGNDSRVGSSGEQPVTTTSDDEQAYIDYGEQLREAVADSIRPWLREQLQGRFGIDPDLLADEIAAVATDTDARLEELVHADVDTPLSGPLERIRGAVEQLNPRLAELGAVPPTRDPFDVRIRPNDIFALGPVAFFDLGDRVHEAGITWGAAKAYLHQARRK